MMRILFMTNLYPSPVDPYLAPFNRQLVQHLASVHPISVIAPIPWTDEVKHRLRRGSRIPGDRRVELDGVGAVHPRFYYPPRMLRSWYGRFFQASVGRTFRRVVAQFRPDVVHVAWAYPDAWAAVRLGHEAGLPVLVKVLGSDVRALDMFPARRAGTIEALRNADGVVAVSNELAARISEFGVAPEKIRVIYDGVNPELFFPGSKTEARTRLGLPVDGLQFLFVGNLLHVKGVDVLLTACDLLYRTGFRFKLNVIGKGPLRGRLEAQAETCNLTDVVRFIGQVPQQDLPHWYRAADLFLLPSRSEGLPNVLLEASACHTPWVATSVGGNPEIAHLGMSRLVRPDNSRELAAAIRDQSENPPSDAKPSFVRSRLETALETIAFLEHIIAHRRQSAPKGQFAASSNYSR